VACRTSFSKDSSVTFTVLMEFLLTRQRLPGLTPLDLPM